MPQGVKCSVQCFALFKNSIMNHRNGKKYTLTMAMATTVEWQVMVMVMPSRGIFILILIFILFHAHHLPTMRPSRYALGFAVNGSNNRVLVSCNLTNPLFWSSSSHSFVTVYCVCVCLCVCVRINSKLAIKTKNVIKLPSLITFIHHITFYQQSKCTDCNQLNIERETQRAKSQNIAMKMFRFSLTPSQKNVPHFVPHCCMLANHKCAMVVCVWSPKITMPWRLLKCNITSQCSDKYANITKKNRQQKSLAYSVNVRAKQPYIDSMFG